jgi:hypothetical protein
VQHRPDQQHRQEEAGHYQQHPDDLVDLSLKRRQRHLMRLGPGRDDRGGAGRTDPLRLVEAAPADAEAAGGDLVADLLRHHVGLAGQQRLVDLERPLDDPAVDEDLVTRADRQQIPLDDLLRPHLAPAAVADDGRLRPVQQGDLVEPSLGDHLLDDADQPVDHRQAGGQDGVADEPHRDEHAADREQGDVDEGEEVVADDLPVGASGPRPRRVGQAPGVALPRLRFGEAGVGGQRGRIQQHHGLGRYEGCHADSSDGN